MEACDWLLVVGAALLLASVVIFNTGALYLPRLSHFANCDTLRSPSKQQQQPPSKEQQSRTDSPLRLEQCRPVMVKTRRHCSLCPPELQTSGSVAGSTQKRPATATTVSETSATTAGQCRKRAASESWPRSAKRRKIQTRSLPEQLGAVTKTRETKVTASHRHKKKRVSVSSPRFTKRHTPSLQGQDVDAAAQTARHRTDAGQGETCVTTPDCSTKNKSMSSSNKQDTQTDAAATPFPPVHMPGTPATSEPSQPFCVQLTSKTEGAEQLSGEESEAVRLLQHQGVRLLQTRDVKALARQGTELLGSGAYGSCHLAVDPHTQQPLVIKTFPDYCLDDVVTEATNMHELRLVPGVQRLVGVCVATRQIISGFAGTTLHNYFSETKPSFADATSVFLQTSRALQQMHEKGFAHNDIKGDNICIEVDNKAPKATVIDLGLARRVGTADIYEYCPFPDAFPWLAPELLLHTHPCSEASDVYGVAHLINKACNMGDMPDHRPRMAALTAWIQHARKLEPSERPSLAALNALLQRLHKEATLGTRE